MVIEHVASSLSLAHRVLRQSTSIVLFVALWSYESFPVSDSFLEITEQLNCSAAVSLFEFDVPITDVDPTRPKEHFLSLPWLPPRESSPRHVAYNITAGIPWFPALRVFTADGGRITFHHTYKGSLSRPSLTKFLRPFCRAPLSDQIESPYAILPMELSDEVYTESGAGVKGILFFSWGHCDLRALSVWEQAIGQLEVRAESDPYHSDERLWLISMFKKDDYRPLAERYGVDADAQYSAIVLLDALHDKIEVIDGSEISDVAKAASLLKKFEEKGEGVWDISQKKTKMSQDRSELILSKAPEWLVESSKLGNFVPMSCAYEPEKCVQRNSAALADFPALQPNSTLWLVVYEPWCAYCQQMVPIFIAFAQRAKKAGVDARVFAMSKVTTLPAAIDHLVDGFPSVLLLRGVEREGAVTEYIGAFNVDALLSHARIKL